MTRTRRLLYLSKKLEKLMVEGVLREPPSTIREVSLMPDEKVIIELVGKTDDLEKKMAVASKAVSTHVRGMVYFFAEGNKQIKREWTAIDEITKGMARLDTIGKKVGESLYNSLGILGREIFAPLKTDIKAVEEETGKAMSAFAKFGASLKNSLLDLIGTIITQGLILAGFIEALNLLPPPGLIGTAVAKFLSGGITVFKGFAEKKVADVEGAMQMGGIVGKVGKYILHPGELVIPTQGVILDNFVDRLAAALAPAMHPQLAIPQQNIIEISPELDGIVKLSARLSESGKKHFGRNVRKAIATDKRADA